MYINVITLLVLVGKNFLLPLIKIGFVQF